MVKYTGVCAGGMIFARGLRRWSGAVSLHFIIYVYGPLEKVYGVEKRSDIFGVDMRPS